LLDPCLTRTTRTIEIAPNRAIKVVFVDENAGNDTEFVLIDDMASINEPCTDHK
jgi:hypothetical protein